jgi:hypothetical protein
MKCIVCEDELVLDPQGFSATAGEVLYCANEYCDVYDPLDYKIKTKGLYKLKKPLALSATGWTNWDAIAKKTHPIRYYLSEKLSYKISALTRYYIHEPLNWVRYRTYNRYHRVNTGLPPGWQDVDNQMLYVNFTMLVDFIEIEKASCMLWTDGEVDTHKWYQKGPFNNWRDADLGIKHLRWEMSLTRGEDYGLKEGDEGFGEMTRQAKSAKEQLELYTWWKVVRPLRGDSMDVSGLTEWYENNRIEGLGVMSAIARYDKARSESESTYKEIQDLHTKTEEDYIQEDIDMLIRLIKIKQTLWS